MSIIVVIPTKNSMKTLRPCLESIKNQNYRDYELIIVDGGSTDGTIELAGEYTDKVFVTGHGRSEARNFGFSMAKGDVFISIDSDMILEPGVFREAAENMSNHGGLIIPEIGYGNDFVSKCKDLEKRCYIGDEIIESSRVFSREAFEKVGGYDSNLVFGEDWDIHSRIKEKFSIGRISSRMLHNTAELDFIGNMKKAYLYGKTLPRYFAKGHPQADEWKKPSKFFFIRHFSKLKCEPLYALGLTAIKGLEYISGFVGFVSAKTKK